MGYHYQLKHLMDVVVVVVVMVTVVMVLQVVSGSGYGWERFAVVPAMNHSGALQTLNPLDYEDPSQRRGFKFKIQVSDQGEAGWQEARHMDSAWVRVLLLDDNDNAPRFATNLINLTLPEDTPLGHSLASFTATDIDQVSDASKFQLLDCNMSHNNGVK
ncbi:putative neural-cadherin 2 [Portunus trituberculatus]|uniref:Putative neural-cadherin 2 n=1 Tax=Portunus trituberculatus TaxID=210409 RepID=A0A5B7IB23_PORTR|nr:putative neural-cadherin 2 [Portunus trituberculatus]